MFNIKDRTDEIIHCSVGSKLRRRDCEGVRRCGRKMALITAVAVVEPSVDHKARSNNSETRAKDTACPTHTVPLLG